MDWDLDNRLRRPDRAGGGVARSFTGPSGNPDPLDALSVLGHCPAVYLSGHLASGPDAIKPEPLDRVDLGARSHFHPFTLPTFESFT